MLYCIHLPLFLLQLTMPKWNFNLSKNQEFTDIDSNENIGFIPKW